MQFTNLNLTFIPQKSSKSGTVAEAQHYISIACLTLHSVTV